MSRRNSPDSDLGQEALGVAGPAYHGIYIDLTGGIIQIDLVVQVDPISRPSPLRSPLLAMRSSTCWSSLTATPPLYPDGFSGSTTMTSGSHGELDGDRYLPELELGRHVVLVELRFLAHAEDQRRIFEPAIGQVGQGMVVVVALRAPPPLGEGLRRDAALDFLPPGPGPLGVGRGTLGVALGEPGISHLDVGLAIVLLGLPGCRPLVVPGQLAQLRHAVAGRDLHSCGR